MKRFFLIFTLSLSALILFSCATNKVQSQSPTGKQETEVYDPRGPQILDMGFSSSMGQNSMAIQKIKGGNSAVLFMKLKDSEWDLSKIIVTAEKDGKKALPISIELGYQYEEEFVFAEKLDAPEEKGKWVFTATAYDHRGNKSKSMSTTVIVE